MHGVRSGFLAAVALSASLALATTAWSRPDGAGAHRAAPSRRRALHTATGQRTQTLGWIAGWYNDGTCHGYPDVMHIYVLFGDSATGTVSSWSDAGWTSGWDSCNNWWEGDYSGDATYEACGCPMWDGHVQGNHAPPDASTTCLLYTSD